MCEGERVMVAGGKEPARDWLRDLVQALAGPIRDIREKLIEEGWFGKRLSADQDIHVSLGQAKEPVTIHQAKDTDRDFGGGRMPDWYEDRRSFVERWGVGEHDPAQSERPRETPGHDHGR